MVREAGMEIKKMTIEGLRRDGLLDNGSAPKCPSCHHYNALLYDRIHNYETMEIVLKCRDCGYLVLVERE